MLLARVSAVLLMLSVTLGQRVYVSLMGNPIDVFAIGFVVMAAVAWFRDAGEAAPLQGSRRLGRQTIEPLFALLVLLPVAGVLVGRYEITTLYSWLTVAVPLSVLSLGRSAWVHGLRLERLAFWMIMAHGLYGLGQTMSRIGLLPPSLWPGREWDLVSQRAMNESYVIYGRSTGLFINPNVFGYWSCGAILVGAVLLNGWRRHVAVVLGVLGVIGSQSRTAWVGLAFLAVVLLIVALRDSVVAGRMFVCVIALAPIVVVGWASGAIERIVESDLVDRLLSGLGVLSEGVGADQNLSGRVDSWSSGLRFVGEYPLGTLGPPQVLFGQFIDNEYVSMLLQGGVLLLGAYLLALLSPLLLARRGVRLAWAIGVASGLVAISAFTMLPFLSTSGSALLWILVAAALYTHQTDERGLLLSDARRRVWRHGS